MCDDCDVAAEVEELREKLDGVRAVAQNALQRNNDLESQLEEYEETIERLTFRVGELETNADPDPESKPYKELDPEEKPAVLKKALVRRAEATNGKALYYYGDVIALFNDYPSPSTAYRIMRQAGNSEGFEFVDNPTGDNDKHIRVNLDETPDADEISAEPTAFEGVTT